MPTCAELKANLQGQLTARARDARYAQQALDMVLAWLAEDRRRLCDTADPCYSPTCCSLFAAYLDGVPGQYKSGERTLMLQQQVVDALAAVDCSSPDWPARLDEVSDQLRGLADWTADMTDRCNRINSWLASKADACPVPAVAENQDQPSGG